MADYHSTDDFGAAVGDEWLFDQTTPSMFSPSGGLDGGAYELDAAGLVAAGAGLLHPYSTISPGEYVFGADTVATSAANISASSMQPPEPGRLYCNRSGCINTEGFTRPSDLRRHQQKHDKLHKCSECVSRFGSKADKERHMREVHGKDTDNGKPSLHHCPVTTCKRHQRGFPRLWNMQQHYGKMHGGPLPSPQSSPTVCSMDTPRFSSSGESAPNTPPSSVDEPATTPKDPSWMPPLPATAAFASSPTEADDNAARGLILRRLKELESQRLAGTRETTQLQAALRQLDMAGN